MHYVMLNFNLFLNYLDIKKLEPYLNSNLSFKCFKWIRILCELIALEQRSRQT
jgi:hypothetical protein